MWAVTSHKEPVFRVCRFLSFLLFKYGLGLNERVFGVDIAVFVVGDFLCSLLLLLILDLPAHRSPFQWFSALRAYGQRPRGTHLRKESSRVWGNLESKTLQQTFLISCLLSRLSDFCEDTILKLRNSNQEKSKMELSEMINVKLLSWVVCDSTKTQASLNLHQLLARVYPNRFTKASTFHQQCNAVEVKIILAHQWWRSRWGGVFSPRKSNILSM